MLVNWMHPVENSNLIFNSNNWTTVIHGWLQTERQVKNTKLLWHLNPFTYGYFKLDYEAKSNVFSCFSWTNSLIFSHPYCTYGTGKNIKNWKNEFLWNGLILVMVKRKTKTFRYSTIYYHLYKSDTKMIRHAYIFFQVDVGIGCHLLKRSNQKKLNWPPLRNSVVPTILKSPILK